VEALEDRYCLSPGGLQWADPFGMGNPGTDSGAHVATDSAGNVYVAGSIGSPHDIYAPPWDNHAPTPVNFDPSGAGAYVTAPGSFVAKYSPSGALLWAVGVAQPTSYTIDSSGFYSYSGGGTASGIAVDGSGNILIAGGLSGQVTFGSFTLSSSNGNGYLAKLDPNGNYLWVENLGGVDGALFPDFSAGAPILALAVDTAGNSYITGQMNNPQATFGSITVTLPSGGQGVFVAKFDPNGTALWADGMGRDCNRFGQYGEGLSIALDKAGNVYVAGDYAGKFDFDPGPGHYILSSIFGPHYGYKTSTFVEKLTANGSFIWADSFDSDAVWLSAMTFDGNGNVYLTGFFVTNYLGNDFDPGKGTYSLDPSKGGGFFEKLDTNGKFVWAENIAAGPTSIAVDSSGNIYVGGHFSGTVDFDPGAGTTNLTSAGGADAFILKLSNAGAFLSALDMGGAGNDTVTGIAIDPLGDVYLVGTFQLTATFGSTILTAQGDTNFFLAELN